MSFNVVLKEGFSQVCVWEGTTVGNDNIQNFEGWLKEKFGVRGQYLEEIKTKPDIDYSEGNTGGRNDLLFAIHSEDIFKFAVKRLEYGIRWIEDVFNNGNGYLYPERVEKYKTW